MLDVWIFGHGPGDEECFDLVWVIMPPVTCEPYLPVHIVDIVDIALCVVLRTEGWHQRKDFVGRKGRFHCMLVMLQVCTDPGRRFGVAADLCLRLLL